MARVTLVLALVGIVVTALVLAPAIQTANQIRRAHAALEVGDLHAAQDRYRLALQLSPQSVIAHRGLARTELAAGHPEQAVADLETALRLRPQSPLVQQELAQAYDRVGRFEQGDALWASSGATAEQFVRKADAAFATRAHAEALQWYRRALRQSPESRPDLLFKGAIAGLLSGDAEASALLEQLQQQQPGVIAYELIDQLTIRGIDLRWISPGIPEIQAGALLPPGQDDAYGGLPVLGEAGVVMLAPQGGTYVLRARLSHGSPPPLEMAIGIDRQPLQTARLDRADYSWQPVETELTIAPGPHVLSVWYTAGTGYAAIEGFELVKREGGR